jgi:hypothetical protein
MDLPVLRYLDVLIGLAVVALLAGTIVTAVTQLILSSTYARARNLRDGLEDLITQIDPQQLAPHARYIVERLLRHPLVARDNTLLGQAAWWVRDRLRRWRDRLPLPHGNPPDTIQREEIILLLLELASPDGAMHAQEGSWGVAAERIKPMRDALRAALRTCGIADPAGAAKAIRERIMHNEFDHPELAAELWRAQAVVAAAASDFVASIHAWYDNTMARVTQNYALTAKVVATVVAAAVVGLVQIDAVNLLQRLAQDDKLRASLVAEADIQTKRIADAPKTGAGPTAEAEDARKQREAIAASLTALRDPSRNIVPSYLAFQKVAQARVCAAKLPPGPAVFNGRILAGPDSRPFNAELHPNDAIDELGAAIRKSGAPVSVYDDEAGCLRLVAQRTGIEKVEVARIAGDSPNQSQVPVSEDLGKRRDSFGFQARLPGILLMWVLVSLGAPFWYDLLKKLLGFRSILARKDDAERKSRQDQQAPPPAASAPAPSPPVQPPAAPAGGEDKRGDLNAPGGEG